MITLIFLVQSAPEEGSFDRLELCSSPIEYEQPFAGFGHARTGVQTATLPERGVASLFSGVVALRTLVQKDAR